MRFIHSVIIILLSVFIQACTQEATQESPLNKSAKPVTQSYLKLYEVEGSYEDVRQDFEDALTNKGIVISGISHVSDMLQRTGKDLGFTGKIYEHAEAINFCSAVLSRTMMQADPSNIVFCPYVVAIYSLPDKPGVVYLAYRRPPLLPTKASTEALAAFEKLVKDIIEDAAM